MRENLLAEKENECFILRLLESLGLGFMGNVSLLTILPFYFLGLETGDLEGDE